MSTTDLATTDTGNAEVAELATAYPAFDPTSTTLEALRENLGDDVVLSTGDLTQIKVPSGGETEFRIPTLTGSNLVKTIKGIIVAQQQRRTAWRTAEPTEGDTPLCASMDGKVGYSTIEDGATAPEVGVGSPDNPDGKCLDCKFNAYGTSLKGEGKRCGEQKLLFVARPSDPTKGTKGDSLPIVVRVPPTSLKNVTALMVALSKEGVSHYAAVVELALEAAKSGGGQSFAKIKVNVLDVLTGPQLDAVRAYKEAFQRDVLDPALEAGVRAAKARLADPDAAPEGLSFSDEPIEATVVNES